MCCCVLNTLWAVVHPLCCGCWCWHGVLMSWRADLSIYSVKAHAAAGLPIGHRPPRVSIGYPRLAIGDWRALALSMQSMGSRVGEPAPCSLLAARSRVFDFLHPIMCPSPVPGVVSVFIDMQYSYCYCYCTLYTYIQYNYTVQSRITNVNVLCICIVYSVCVSCIVLYSLKYSLSLVIIDIDNSMCMCGTTIKKTYKKL